MKRSLVGKELEPPPVPLPNTSSTAAPQAASAFFIHFVGLGAARAHSRKSHEGGRGRQADVLRETARGKLQAVVVFALTARSIPAMRNDGRTRPPLPTPAGARHHAALLEEVGSEASRYLEQSRADNTRRAYRADWEDFTAWCKKYHRAPLPALPDTVDYYLADRSQDLKTSTLERRLADIAEAHRAAGHQSPNKSAQVKLVWAGIRREKGVAKNHKKPTLTKHIREMVDHLPQGLLGVRDRALILLGFAGAMRRSE